MHHSFAWCFFFYLSFLFPPVEPGVFNCCVTIIKTAPENSGAYYMYHCVNPSFFAISAVLSSSSLETPSSCIVTP